MATSTLVRALLVGTLLGAAVVAPPARAQGKPKDAQSAFEPSSGPGAGQEFLKTFEGDWTVDKVFHRASGEDVHTPGECHQQMIQGGLFLQSDFTFHEKDGKTTTGTGISGFDPKSGLFLTVWYDSRSPRMSLRTSHDPFDGQHIVLYSVSAGPSWGGEHESRTETHLEDGGRKLVHQQFTTDKDGKERVLLELILTRKGDAPAKN